MVSRSCPGNFKILSLSLSQVMPKSERLHSSQWSVVLSLREETKIFNMRSRKMTFYTAMHDHELTGR